VPDTVAHAVMEMFLETLLSEQLDGSLTQHPMMRGGEFIAGENAPDFKHGCEMDREARSPQVDAEVKRAIRKSAFAALRLRPLFIQCVYRSDDMATDQIFAPGAKDVVRRSPERKIPV
jgi:hypothetical protein